MVTDDDLRLIDEKFQHIIKFGKSIAANETTDIWFANLLVALIDSTLTEYRHLKIGFEKHTGLEAWACRNLLELNIFSQYVLTSESAARRFIGDRLIDGSEIFKSFKQQLLRLDPSAETNELDETLRMVGEQLKIEGITSDRYLSTRALADTLGLTDEYVHMNRVCSKLVHPTAWSVLAMTDEGELGLLKTILFLSGAKYGLQIGQKIEDHVAQNGLAPRR